MKVTMWVVTTLANGEKLVSEEHDLELGKYNEFYLPVLMGPRKSEAWVEITGDDGEVTKLHLKR